MFCFICHHICHVHTSTTAYPSSLFSHRSLKYQNWMPVIPLTRLMWRRLILSHMWYSQLMAQDRYTTTHWRLAYQGLPCVASQHQTTHSENWALKKEAQNCMAEPAKLHLPFLLVRIIPWPTCHPCGIWPQCPEMIHPNAQAHGDMLACG